MSDVPAEEFRPRVLVVGYHAFDVVVPVSGTSPPDCKTEVERITLGGGGPGATAAVALARLGARTSLVTTLTDDLPGRLQREELAAAGVDISHCPVETDHRSPLAVILADAAAETRSIFWCRGSLPRLAADAVDPAWLTGCDLLYCDGHEPAASLCLARAAAALDVPVVLDAGSVRDGSTDLVAACTDVISSRRFAPDLTGREDPVAALKALRKLGPSRVGMTFGEQGVLALESEQPFVVRAFAVEVKDTTGAGDAFHAGYARARAERLPLRACLELGAAVAALKCRDWGGRRSLPSLAEARDLLANGSRREPGPELARFDISD